MTIGSQRKFFSREWMIARAFIVDGTMTMPDNDDRKKTTLNELP